MGESNEVEHAETLVLTNERKVRCPKCHGNGFYPIPNEANPLLAYRCRTCDESGFVMERQELVRRELDGSSVESEPPDCLGHEWWDCYGPDWCCDDLCHGEDYGVCGKPSARVLEMGRVPLPDPPRHPHDIAPRCTVHWH